VHHLKNLGKSLIMKLGPEVKFSKLYSKTENEKNSMKNRPRSQHVLK